MFDDETGLAVANTDDVEEVSNYLRPFRCATTCTEPAIQLVPLLASTGSWGRRHTPVSRELSIRAQLLEEGGPPLWEALMSELRAIHLGAPKPGSSVLDRLQVAYLEALAAKQR